MLFLILFNSMLFLIFSAARNVRQGLRELGARKLIGFSGVRDLIPCTYVPILIPHSGSLAALLI
jgi:hypothetical protein